MSVEVMISLVLAAAAGCATSAIYLLWPRRMTAEEWVLRRRAMSEPPPPVAKRAAPVQSEWPAFLRIPPAVRRIAAADLALLKLASGPGPWSEKQLGRQLIVGLTAGAGAGLLLLTLALLANSSAVSAGTILLPLAVAPLLPAGIWLRMRRRAAQIRAEVEQRLPRLLLSARVLLESGAATPQAALSHAVSAQKDVAAALVREALRSKEVQARLLEDALEDTSGRYAVPYLARLAGSFRIGHRQGTAMAELLGEQSIRLRQLWFISYRERITKAPVLMTLPALVFFVLPLLMLILFMVFVPLLVGLGQV